MPTRLPTIVTANGQKASAPVSMRRTAVSSDLVQDPAKLAQVLTHLQSGVNDATLAARMNLRNSGTTRKGVTVTANTPFTVRHNLNRLASWCPVRWVATSGLSIWEIAGTATVNSVTLECSSAGTLDLELF